MNPSTNHWTSLLAFSCDEFADYFKEKTANIRSNIGGFYNATTTEETFCEVQVNSFSLVDAEMLREVVATLK